MTNVLKKIGEVIVIVSRLSLSYTATYLLFTLCNYHIIIVLTQRVTSCDYVILCSIFSFFFLSFLFLHWQFIGRNSYNYGDQKYTLKLCSFVIEKSSLKRIDQCVYYYTYFDYNQQVIFTYKNCIFFYLIILYFYFYNQL